jgi:hypothetical protein
VGSFQYNLLAENLRWPTKCMFCGTEAKHAARASISDISDSGLTSYTIRRRSIEYPVCQKHRFICFILDLPERIRFVWTVLAFLPIALAIALKKIMLMLDMEHQIQIMTYFVIIGYVLVFAYLFLSKRFLPVRVSHVNSNVLKVTIRNNNRYLEVMSMNMDHIFSK